ncbi:hypothetical protein N7541_000914 [Penicillium brevicompactum]|uniref:BTB domain-containing protein n=1 Tax=Penicillium brevicompactum TaxID=5074 RepID=A0A9W9RZV1_PENBR|nr:hypothetical protein N7541_000914 [Penicillium brevicompactum]
MAAVRDYSSIIHSPSFTFLVGPKHTKLTIQSGLAQHVSKPLHNLMNGHTRESKHRIAVLEEEDVETFVAFCEYAYTGDYSVPQPEPEPQPEEEPTLESATSNATWRQAYRTGSVASTVPPPAPSPPPEHRHSTHGSVSGSAYQESQPDTLVPECPTPVPEPEPEVNSEEPPAPAPAPEAEPATSEHEDDITVYEEAESAPAAAESEARVEEFPEVSEEPSAVPAEEPAQWELDEAPVISGKKIKGKKMKKMKKGKKVLEPTVEAEPSCEPVNLTPPSTPSPIVAVPEPEADAGWQTETPWPTEPEPAAEPAPEPEPEPPAEDWHSEASPRTAAPMEDSWIQDRANRQRPMLDMSFAQQQAAVSPCEPGLSLWDEFASLQYNDESEPEPPTFPTLPYLTFHAKVYVFATRYLIPALAQLCLRKLHADLLTLPDEPVAQAQIILDLVHYAYTKTARLEPISPTSATQLRENELRKLVVHYAACKVKELARYRVESATGTPQLRPVDKVGVMPRRVSGACWI